MDPVIIGLIIVAFGAVIVMIVICNLGQGDTARKGLGAQPLTGAGPKPRFKTPPHKEKLQEETKDG